LAGKQTAQEKDSAMKKILSLAIQAAIFCSMLFASASLAATINYDTAWTYVYDGGRLTTGLKTAIADNFLDIKALPDGSCYCVGTTSDTANWNYILLDKFDGSGKLVLEKHLVKAGIGRSIVLGKNNDLIIGGGRGNIPFLLRSDTLGNIKWTTWVYDSVNNQRIILSRGATINCVRESKRGTIICAAGDYFTDQNYLFGSSTYDYAAALLFDSTGKLISYGEAGGQAGYASGGFDIEETSTSNFVLSGNQSILYMDSAVTHQIWEKKYTFMLNGVGSEVNNITRCKMLRDGSLMVAGQAYEGNCWTKFQHLYYDAWWSPISYAYGTNTTWDTAGFQGGSDQIYDFTQLNNGNLIFVGNRAYGPGGIWTFVTDSTGKNLLWEKQTPIPYKSNTGTTASAYSVCATADGGFTVAGELILPDSLGGHNAMAAHFVPASAGAITARQVKTSFSQVSVRVIANHVLVTNENQKAPATVSLYDVVGKRIAIQKGEKEISLDISNVARGTYIVQVKNAGITRAEKIVIEQ
jgi:Secretion system C-terminal sorting domain